MAQSKKRILTYLGLIVLLASYFYYILISEGTFKGNEVYVIGLMWVPAAAAILTKLIYDKSLKGLGVKRSSLKYLLAAYLLPIVCGLVVYSFVWVTGLAGFRSIGVLKIISLGTLGVLLSCVIAAGEEIGWRGFMVPELMKKNSFIKTSVIAAVIWYTYHLPVMIFSDYNGGAPLGFTLIFFAISIISVTFIANYLTVKSKSVWPAVLIHGSHNLFIPSIFGIMTIDKEITKYITTEFGIGLAITYLIVALFIIKKVLKDKALMLEGEAAIV